VVNRRYVLVYLEYKLQKSVVFVMASGICLIGFVAFLLGEIVDSSDEEETDGKYTFGFSKLY